MRPASASGASSASQTPLWKLRQKQARRREGEACFPDAAGPRQRDEPMRRDELQNLGQLIVAPDQVRYRLRHVRQPQRRFGGGACGSSASNGRRRDDAGFGGELVAPSAHGADQAALRAESGAQRRNLSLKVILLDNPVGPDARHQRILADDPATRLDQCDQHIKRAPAELERAAIREQLAAVRQYLEATERDVGQWFGSRIH